MSNDSARQHLIGTWKLIAAVREEISSGTKTEFLGPNPVGYINYGADGRMLVLTVGSGRHKPAGPKATSAEVEALFRSMTSYGGTYTIDGNEITHHVFGLQMCQFHRHFRRRRSVGVDSWGGQDRGAPIWRTGALPPRWWQASYERPRLRGCGRGHHLSSKRPRRIELGQLLRRLAQNKTAPGSPTPLTQGALGRPPVCPIQL
jgi:hypothetical protein